MQRRNYMLSDRHIRWLEKEAKDKGVSMSEVLRSVIDAYLIKEGQKR